MRYTLDRKSVTTPLRQQRHKLGIGMVFSLLLNTDLVVEAVEWVNPEGISKECRKGEAGFMLPCFPHSVISWPALEAQINSKLPKPRFKEPVELTRTQGCVVPKVLMGIFSFHAHCSRSFRCHLGYSRLHVVNVCGPPAPYRSSSDSNRFGGVSRRVIDECDHHQ